MNRAELAHILSDPTAIQSGTVMVLTEGGVIYDVKEVETEHHEDADGSTTVWLKVEEV